MKKITTFSDNKFSLYLTGLIIICLALVMTDAANAQTGPPFTDGDYALALDYNNMFYEAQRAGDTDDSRYMPRRLDWRTPNLLDDGSDVGVDLTGGWFDAGDHVKFHLPMAYSAGIVGMGVVQFEAAYRDAGAYDRALDNLRWVNDYFIKANPSPGVFYGQVADGDDDHSWWGPPELIGQSGVNYPMPRKSFLLTGSCGGDILGATAGSLAQASIAFRRNGETAYADELLTAAETYYAEAITRPSTFNSCIPGGFYGSGDYKDDWMMGAISLYWAAEEKAAGSGSGYLTDAQSHYTSGGSSSLEGGIGYWMMDWDNNQYAALLLLAQATGTAAHENKIEFAIEQAVSGGQGTYTPGGMWQISAWGSARHPANASFLALAWAKHLEDTGGSTATISQYRDWSKEQIDYLLGDNNNNYSFVVGFGSNGATLPHHRGAHLSDPNGNYPGSNYNSWNENDAGPNKNILYGALVGGPGGNDDHNDSRGDYVQNEVATDYNAGFMGALAGIYDYRVQPAAVTPTPTTPPASPTPCPGGSCPPTATPVTPTATPTNTPIPPTATPDPSAAILVESSININDQQSDYQMLVTNQSDAPVSNASIRIFFSVAEGISANEMVFEVDYTEVGATAGSPVAWMDDLYYIEISIADTLAPNDPGIINGRLHLSNYSNEFEGGNDPSAAGLTNSQTQTQNIPVYISGSYISGVEPGVVQVTNTPVPTNTPEPTDTPEPTATTSVPLAVGMSNSGTNHTYSLLLLFVIVTTGMTVVWSAVRRNN